MRPPTAAENVLADYKTTGLTLDTHPLKLLRSQLRARRLRTVAEGVETEDHLRFLREYGCQELQGYLFSRPLPAASFENLLSERARLLAEIADE